MAFEPPSIVRATAFIDGQNLFRHAKEAFGYYHPNFDPIKLHNAVCAEKGWVPHGTRFYTGIPSAKVSPMWSAYWSSRLLAMRRAGVTTFSRQIRYSTQEHALSDGTIYEVDVAQEKGVDVRIAIDIMRLAVSNQFDVALVFSQDQDLSEVAGEIREISNSLKRWIWIASAYPDGPSASSTRGIDKSDWIKIDREFYDKCLDSYDYRPKTIHPKHPRSTIRVIEHAPY